MTAWRRILGLNLRLITPDLPLYRATAAELDALECGEPFWAFAWPGSFALAEMVQAQPDLVSGKRVLDVASGCGISALAAVQAGAERVIVNDIDPFALAAVEINACENLDRGEAARLQYSVDNMIGDAAVADDHDVIILGDICYEEPLAAQVREWLEECVGRNPDLLVLLGDPGRPAFLEAFAPARRKIDERLQFPDGSLSALLPDNACTAEGSNFSPVHTSALDDPAVSDTSHGLTNAYVWRVERR
jgi:predicted nicotinamide N-methyase